MSDSSNKTHPVASPEQYFGRSATIMGLGQFGGGVAAARFLARHGAIVTITDLKPEAELKDSLDQLHDVPIDRCFFGSHPDEAFTCDLLIVNPAVKPGNPFVEACRAKGVDVTTEVDLFLRHNPAPVIAVTGSNGKSTTTALIHHLLLHQAPAANSAETSIEKDRPSAGRFWLGGNIGVSLLPHLSEITPDDIVVLELSSFQLESLRARRFRPQIAVLTNFSANHLDWHGSIAAYQKAKQAIFDAQTGDDVAIVPDSESEEIPWKTRAQQLRFGTIDHGEDGAFLEQGSLILRSAGGTFEDVVRLTVPSQLPGIHNHLNIAAAACAAWQAGADPEQFSTALKSFQPLPHRLQWVAEVAGRQFWNDSIATTPESAMMALRVFSNRIILLAGGYDKGQDLADFAAEIRSRADAVILMGQTAGTLKGLVKTANPEDDIEVRVATDFKEAFAQAVALSQQGDIVLLSPGCASYGWFRDYRERGDLFTSLAREWRPVE